MARQCDGKYKVTLWCKDLNKISNTDTEMLDIGRLKDLVTKCKAMEMQIMKQHAFDMGIYFQLITSSWMRVSSVVAHSSANSKVPGSIPGPVSYPVMDYDEACLMHLIITPVQSGPQLPKGCGCTGFLSPMHKKIPDSYLKREGGNPRNSGLLSQQKMVVHYPRTMWKNSYTEHEVTGKIYNKKKHI